MEVNELHHLCNEPGRSHNDISVKVTFPIGTSLSHIAKWIKQAPRIIHLFDDCDHDEQEQH